MRVRFPPETRLHLSDFRLRIGESDFGGDSRARQGGSLRRAMLIRSASPDIINIEQGTARSTQSAVQPYRSLQANRFSRNWPPFHAHHFTSHQEFYRADSF